MKESESSHRRPTLLEAIVAVVVSFACIGVGSLPWASTFTFPS